MSDQSFRKKWDLAKYTSKQPQSVSESNQFKQISLTDIKLGKSSNASSAFYCNCCKYSCNDYNSYLEHINNWRHRKTASKHENTVKRTVSVEGIRDLLDRLVQEQKQISAPATITADEVDQTLKRKEDERELRKEAKKAKRNEQPSTEMDAQMQEMLRAGFDFVAKCK